MAPNDISWRGILTYSLLSALQVQPTISSVSSSSHLPSRRDVTVQFSALNTRQDGGNDTLVQITSPDFGNIAFGSDNGNLYLEQEASIDPSSGVDTTTLFWADSAGNIYSDYNDRFFHIYSAEAATYGVSRLRLHNSSDLPNTSVLVSLIPIANSATSGSTLVAITSNSQTYFLAACNIEGQNTKVFAISTYPDGLSTLQSTAMQSIITGGVVDECVLINLTNEAHGRSS